MRAGSHAGRAVDRSFLNSRGKYYRKVGLLTREKWD